MEKIHCKILKVSPTQGASVGATLIHELLLMPLLISRLKCTLHFQKEKQLGPMREEDKEKPFGYHTMEALRVWTSLT